jgi:hypothetical protein
MLIGFGMPMLASSGAAVRVLRGAVPVLVSSAPVGGKDSKKGLRTDIQAWSGHCAFRHARCANSGRNCHGSRVPIFAIS